MKHSAPLPLQTDRPFVLHQRHVELVIWILSSYGIFQKERDLITSNWKPKVQDPEKALVLYSK